jgi:glycosyltransferase involved in cell wall biosynthesis
MKIWVFNQTAGKLDSGWGERHMLLAKYWNPSGDTVIFSGSYNHLFKNQPKTKGLFTTEKIDDGLSFCWVKIWPYHGESVFKLWSMIAFSFKLLILPFYRKEKPDVILISSMPIFSVIPAYLLAKWYRSRFIFEVRDLWPETPKELKGYSNYHPVVIVMRWIERLGYKNANAIVSVLPKAHVYIDKISKKPEKFNYIPNGIEPSIFSEKTFKSKYLELIPKDKFVVGYAGTLGLANAMEYFIEAIRLLENDERFFFVFVGDGYLLNNFKSTLKGNKNVLFIPKIEKAYMQSMISNFDLCYLSRYDRKLYQYGVSYNKYYDYMYASKPVLESSAFIGDPVEYSQCGIIVKPEDPQAIIKGLEEFYHMSPEERRKIGAFGRKFVEENHLFSILGEKYKLLFNNVS